MTHTNELTAEKYFIRPVASEEYFLLSKVQKIKIGSPTIWRMDAEQFEAGTKVKTVRFEENGGV